MDPISLPRSCSSSRLSGIKTAATAVSAFIGAAIPMMGAYLLWSWCIAQVPTAVAWAGMAKVGITLGMVLIGGATTVGLAITLGALAGMAVAAVLGLLD